MRERENGGPGRYYLYVGGHDLSPSNVFFDVRDEWAAQELCGLFTDEYDSGDGDRFRYKHITTKSLWESIWLEEALNDVRLYDPGVFDLPPPNSVIERAQYARRASAWYERLLRRHDQARQSENLATEHIGSSCPIPSNSVPDITLEHIQRLLEKHRLTFLYFAAPRRQNPLNWGKPWETVHESDLPNIPIDEIDSEGKFLFSYRRTIDRFAQAAIARFGTGEGDVPRIMDQSGTVVEVVGGSRPYWVLDEHACVHLEESADAILDACRRAMNGNSCRPHVRLLVEVKGVLRDEGMTKWYSANIVRWRYLMRLDETIHALTTADFNVSSDTSIDDDSQMQGSSTDAFPDFTTFPTPQGASWEDVIIKVIDGETVSIRVGEQTKRCLFSGMGMIDRRNARPTKQWELLRAFADNQGVMTWQSAGAHRKNQKRKENLAKNLKAFFGIPCDPIVLTDDNKGWRARFSISNS